MSFFWRSFVKEARRQLRDPLAILLWIGIPACILLLVSLAFGGARSGGAQPQGLLLIADHDDTFASRFLADAFRQRELGDLFQTLKVGEPEGRKRIEKGTATALLVIPKGFQSALLLNAPCRLLLVTNPSQRIMPGIAKELLTIGAEGVHYIHLVGGEPLRRVLTAKGEWSEAAIAAISVEFNRIATGLAKYLDPPLLDVNVAKAQPRDSGRPFNLTLYFFRGMIYLGLLFLASGASADLWKEARSGAFRRLKTSGRSTHLFLMAKLASALALALLVSVISLAAGRWLMEVPVASFALAAAWLVLSAAAFYLLFAHLQLFASAEEGGQLLCSLFLFPSAMLGGSFFPVELLPAALRTVSAFTPLGWAIRVFTAIQNGDASALLTAGAAIVGVSALLFWLACRRLEAKFLGS